MQKSGVSDVVATVLIIVLTIIAISILWVGVMPMIRSNLGVGDICSKVDVSISTSQGYTCYQQNGITSVQVAKGSEDLNISGLKFYLLSNGNSIQYSKDIALGKNTFTSFFLNSSAISSVDKIQVVPVVKNGNVVKDCPATYISSVSTCGSAGFSAAEIAQVINASNGTTSGSGGSTQDTNYPQFSNYQDNNATLLDSGIGLFNVTVANTNGTVLLEINNTNVTANSLGNGIYSASYSVSNGTYSYRWYSYGDGASHNLGVSANRNYVVHKAGNALNLNGNGATFGSWFNYQNFTISMWVKPGSSQVQYADILDNYHNSVYNWVIQQNYTDINSYAFYDKSFYLSSDTWSYLVLAKNGSNCFIYINGILNISATCWPSGINYDTYTLLTLGNWGRNGGRQFNGIIDELLFFNRSITALDVSQMYNSGMGLYANLAIAPFNSGLVSGYHLDETIGTVAYDITGRNNGTFTNSPGNTPGKVMM